MGEKNEAQVSLKLKRRHPLNKMRLGRHVITNKPELFTINQKELNELKSEGGKHWFELCKEVLKSQPKEKDKK